MEQKMNQHDKIKIERIKDQHNEIKIEIENKAGYQMGQITVRYCQIKTPVATTTITHKFWADRSLMGDPMVVA